MQQTLLSYKDPFLEACSALWLNGKKQVQGVGVQELGLRAPGWGPRAGPGCMGMG